MLELFRDTIAGQLIHKLSCSRLLQYPEEQPQSQHRQYISRSNTATSELSRWTSTRNPAFRDLELSRTTTGRSNHFSNNEDLDLSNKITRTRSKADESAAREDTQLSPNYSGGNSAVAKKNEVGFLVTWSGPDDPANPQNWSLFKKCFVSALMCILTFSIYIGSAIYTSGEVGIETQFGVSETAATLGLTLFVFGYGLGPMFLAPLAEAPPIGRTPVYIVTLFVFVAFNFGVVYAQNIGMLLAFRFLTGFFGSPVLATGGATLGDMWSNKKLGYAIGVWGLFAVCGPTMGPLVSGFAVEAEGWKWAIWELIWLSGACFVTLCFTLPETSSMTILYRRTRRLRKATSNSNLKSEADIESESMEMKDIITASLWRPFQLTFAEPILLALDVYLGLIYALLYTWFEAFPLTFIDIYHFTLGTEGLAFIGLFIGSIVIFVPYCIWLRLVQEKQFDEHGNIAPEKRLPPAVVGSFFIPVALFWYGWSSCESIHWIMPIIASGIFAAGAVLLFNSVLNYQGDAYPKYVGSVLAGNDLMRSGMGGAFPLFAPALYHRLGLGWGCSLLGFLSIAFILIPMLLYKYGKRIRMASRYARHDI